MKKQIIIGTMGSQDPINYVPADRENLIKLPLLSDDTSLNYGLKDVLDQLVKLGVYPSALGLDLFILATHVYAADTRISRKSESQDTWTRELKLIVPVSNASLWNAVAEKFKTLLGFLTGDRWEIEFRARPEASASLLPAKPEGQADASFTKLQLFSGGLDSLIGAIDNLAEAGTVPLFISHAGEGAVSDAQYDCYDILKEDYEAKSFDRLRLWMSIPKKIFKGIKSEDSTRGRSFLFFSLGVLAGTGLTQPFTLETPENGLIALNVPLDVLRLGSLSTHTTHPFYMRLWNTILTEVGIAGQIINPYEEQTKGEMVANCKAPSVLKKLLPLSLSCSSPTKYRWQGYAVIHCGYCLPCLIRRAAVHSGASFEDETKYYIDDLRANKLNSLKAEGHQIRSFQLAMKRINKNPALVKVLIHKSGPLPKDADKLEKYAAVYQKGMAEIGELLEGVVTQPEI